MKCGFRRQLSPAALRLSSKNLASGPAPRIFSAGFVLIFSLTSCPLSARATYEDIPAPSGVHGTDDDGGNGLDHHTMRGGAGQGLSGTEWTDDIDWEKEKKPRTPEEEKEEEERRKKRQEERDRKKKERADKERREKEERERKKQEREDKRRQEREERERREQERRDRARRGADPAPAPKPPIRTGADDGLLGSWLRSKNVGYPGDWMKLSPALRNELFREAMQEMMKERRGMPPARPLSESARAQLLGQAGMLRGNAEGNLRSWMSSGSSGESSWEDKIRQKVTEALRAIPPGSDGNPYVTEDGRTVSPQPPTAFGPWPGETETEWVERLASNMWQSTYDKALWDIQQQRIARQNMGYRESDINEYQRRLAAQQSGYDPQAEADMAQARWLADLAAKNALDPQYREWLKTVDEKELQKINMHRDGTMRVSMGVAKRGSGMGPQLNFDKRDAADAADRARRAAQNQWELDTARANLARMEADRQARADQRAADAEARRQQRIANADAARAAAGETPRLPATATWVDDQGQTHVWTSRGTTRSITTTDSQGRTSTQTVTTGTGAGSASWTDASGARHEWRSEPGGTRTHNVTDASGQTRSVPVTNYSETASASWTDPSGARHTLTSDGKGTRTQTTLTPTGQTTSVTTLSGTGRGTATWVDAGGSTQIWSTDGKGGNIRTTITPGGQTFQQDLRSPAGNFASYRDAQGNEVTITGNPDGSRTQTVAKPDGTATITNLSSRGTFASWTDAAGNRHTLASNGDGTRTLTTSPADGGKTRVEKVGGDQASFIRGTAPDGSEIMIASLPGGRREVTTRDAAGNSTTVVRGRAPDSASSQLPDGTVVRVTNAGSGVREIVTTRPDGTASHEFRGAENASATVRSPDGTTVTVTSRPDGRRDITTFNRDGTTVTETRGKEPSSASSTYADGARVTVVDRGDGVHAVTVTKPDGTSRTEIAGDKPNSAAAVSPDGTIVRVTNLPDGKREVATTTPDGKTTTEIREREPVSSASTPPSNPSATVTLPDGTSITITSKDGGTREVTTVTPDGKTTTESRNGPDADTATVRREDGAEVTAFRGEDGKINVVVTSPDGTRVLNPAVETTVIPSAEAGKETPSVPAAGSSPAQATVSFTDELGRTHTVSRDAEGRRVETIHDKNTNTTQTIEQTANGNTLETTVTQEGTTRTSIMQDANGQRVEITEKPDGSKTTVIVDPVSGQRTVIEEVSDNERVVPSQGHFERRDAEGHLISEGQIDRYGHLHTTDYHEDGSVTRTFVDRRDGSSTSLDLTETGFGTETLRDADGNVLSEREVFVNETTDKDGRRTVTVTGVSDGHKSNYLYDTDGSISSFSGNENGKTEPGRAIFERQRRDLDLSVKWEELPAEDREAYAREQARRDRVEETRENDERWKRAVQVLQERQQQEEAARLAAFEKEFADQEAALQARHEREAAEFEAGLQQQELERRHAAYIREAEARARQERAEFEQRYQQQVSNPSDPSQVRQFQINEILRSAEAIKNENISVAETGRIREPDGLGGFTERAATPEEVENARIGVGLANNLNRVTEVESGNQIAKLEAARNYHRLLQQQGYNDDPREIYMNRPNMRDSLEINDLRGAVRSSGNPVVDAYEQAALDTAAATAHQKVSEGLLRGVGHVTMGLNDFFTSLNPADPFLQAGLGVKTSGTDIGRELSVGERLWQLGTGAIELGVDIGGGLLLQEATRMPGSSRVVPEGSMQNRGYRYDVDTGMPSGGRVSAARNADLPEGAAPALPPRAAPNVPAGTASRAADALTPAPLRNDAGRAVPASPEPLSPPAGLSRDELQAWHDRNAMRPVKEGSDGGDDILASAEAASTLPRPPGAYSSHLNQDQIDALFQPGRTLSGDEITQKLDLIRTGRAPQSTMDPVSALALDISMRRSFPEINMRSPVGGTPPPAPAVNTGSATQNFNQVLPSPGQTQPFSGALPIPPGGRALNASSTQIFNGIVPIPPGVRSFDPGRTQSYTPVLPTPGQAFRSALDLDPSITQRFDAVLPPPSQRAGPGSTQVLDTPRFGPGSTQVLDVPRTGPGSTQVLEVPKLDAGTPIRHNDASAITKPAPGVPVRTQEAPTVGAQRGIDLQPSGKGDALSLKPTIEPRPITDAMLYTNNPPRPMDVNLVKRYPDVQRDASLAKERAQDWIDNPANEALLDAQVREMLKLGAEAGSPDARRVLEHGPAYSYQPDMDAHFGLYDPVDNVFRLNPYKVNPQTPAERLAPRDPVALAGTMVHEAVHGRGLPNQIPGRGGVQGAPPAAPAGTPKSELPAGQGQGQGYNEFRAFFAEGHYYHRMRQIDPKLLDGLDPSSRRLADAFTDGVSKKDPQALRDAISGEIEKRRYERFYTTPEQYGQALTQHRGGSNVRAQEALAKGAQPQTLAGDHIDLKKKFPDPPPAPGPLPPVPPPPAPLPQRPTIVYPGQKNPAPSADALETASGSTAGQSPAAPSDNSLTEKIGGAFNAAAQQVTALKEDSTFKNN